MSMRSVVGRHFPHGWWHSVRWWVSGLSELDQYTVIVLATVMCVRTALFVLQHRDHPSRLATRLQGRADHYLAAVAAHLTGLAWLSLGAITRGGETPPSALLIVLGVGAGLWCLTCLGVAAVVVVVVARSQMRRPDQWRDLWFVERHLPAADRPPETIEEYRAVRLQRDPGER